MRVPTLLFASPSHLDSSTSHGSQWNKLIVSSTLRTRDRKQDTTLGAGRDRKQDTTGVTHQQRRSAVEQITCGALQMTPELTAAWTESCLGHATSHTAESGSSQHAGISPCDSIEPSMPYPACSSTLL